MKVAKNLRKLLHVPHVPRHSASQLLQIYVPLARNSHKKICENLSGQLSSTTMITLSKIPTYLPIYVQEGQFVRIQILHLRYNSVRNPYILVSKASAYSFLSLRSNAGFLGSLFLPVSILVVLSPFVRFVKLFIFYQFWSCYHLPNWIKHVKIRSNLSKSNQTCPNWIKPV